jgi:hypothetical protein
VDMGEEEGYRTWGGYADGRWAMCVNERRDTRTDDTWRRREREKEGKR